MTLEEFLRRFGSALAGHSFWSLGIVLVAGIVASAVCPCTLPVGSSRKKEVSNMKTETVQDESLTDVEVL